MPINVKKENLPLGGFNRLDNKGQIVMMSITDAGPVFIFTEEQARQVFVPWHEIMEYAATTPAEDPKAPAVREIKKPAKP